MAIAIPAIVGLSLLAVLAFLVMYGLRSSARSVFGVIVSALALVPSLIPGLSGVTADIVDKLTHWVEAKWGDSARRVENALGSFLGATAAVVERGAIAAMHAAEWTLYGFTLLRFTVIPRMIGYALAPVTHALPALRRFDTWAWREIRAAEASATKRIGLAGATAAAATVAAALALARAAGALMPGALDYPLGQIKELWRTIDNTIYRRLNQLQKMLAAGVIGGLIVKALTRHLPWYRCANVNRFNRAVCRSPRWNLDGLLSLFADALIVTNICSLIPILEAAANDVAVPLVNELAALAGKLPACQRDRPPTLTVPDLYLPPVRYTGTLYLP
jgi:hypothetical protein